MLSVQRSRRIARSVAAAATVIVAVARCSEPKKDITPASITAVGSTSLTGVVGSQLASPITVIVRNAGGEPIDQTPIVFTVTAGGGSLSTTTVVTDTAGKASTTWTLGPTAGQQTMTATATSLAPLTITATAAAGAASSMTKVAGTDAQTATAGSLLPTPPAVKITDQFGNPLANILVTFAVAGGGGSLTGAAVNTGADGIARAGSWRLGGTAGANAVTASAVSLPALTFTATAVPGSVARVEITNTAPTLLTGQTFKLTARALDVNNNVVLTATINFSSSNSAIATVDATGTITAVGPGAATITASSASVSATQSISIIGHPSGTVVGSVVGRVGGIAVAANTAFIAHPFAHELAFVDLATAATVAATDVTDPAVDVGAPATGTLPIAVATNGSVPVVWFINPTTHARTDSVELGAIPVKIAMTSTGSRVFVDMNNFQMSIIDVASRSTTAQVPIAGTLTAMRMGPGDTLLYVATRLATILEVNTSTGGVRRQFQPTSSVTDISVSPDGKTLFVADGSPSVHMVALANGGLNGNVDFDANVTAVGMTPDGRELWAGVPGQIVAAPFQNGSFDTSASGKRYTIAGAVPGRILFTRSGSFAMVQDDGGNQVFIIR